MSYLPWLLSANGWTVHRFTSCVLVLSTTKLRRRDRKYPVMMVTIFRTDCLAEMSFSKQFCTPISQLIWIWSYESVTHSAGWFLSLSLVSCIWVVTCSLTYLVLHKQVGLDDKTIFFSGNTRKDCTLNQ